MFGAGHLQFLQPRAINAAQKPLEISPVYAIQAMQDFIELTTCANYFTKDRKAGEAEKSRSSIYAADKANVESFAPIFFRTH